MFSYIVARRADSLSIRSMAKLSLDLVAQDQKFLLFEYVESTLTPVLIHEHLSTLGYERIFEACHVFSNGDEEERFLAISFLFGYIGGATYLSSINSEVNISCYNKLFLEATSLMGFLPADVLDFGSGPGLIIKTHILKSAKNIICFDTAECNLKLASDSGLSTINFEQFIGFNSSSIDLIISVYVLHYQSVTRDELHKALSVLRTNGVWVSNFHKSKGIDWFLAEINAYGGFELHQKPSYHGPILLAKKIK